MGVSYDVINKAWSFTEDPLLTRKTVSYPAKRYINIKYRMARVNRNQYEPRDIEASISTTPGKNDIVTETEKVGRQTVQTEYVYKSVEIPLDTSGFPSYRARLNGHLENNLGKALAYSDEVQSAANNFRREQPDLEDQLTTASDNERINSCLLYTSPSPRDS